MRARRGAHHSINLNPEIIMLTEDDYIRIDQEASAAADAKYQAENPQPPKFNTSEWSDIVNALRVATERYEFNARTLAMQAEEMPTASRKMFMSLAEQFIKQANEATEYADRICEAEGV